MPDSPHEDAQPTGPEQAVSHETTGRLTPRPGRRVTRRLVRVDVSVRQGQHAPGQMARTLTAAHNEAVRRYGSDSGGFHAFDVPTASSAGVWVGHFPADSVISRLAWGLIDEALAQRLLEGDRWIGADGEVLTRA